MWEDAARMLRPLTSSWDSVADYARPDIRSCETSSVSTARAS